MSNVAVGELPTHGMYWNQFTSILYGVDHRFTYLITNDTQLPKDPPQSSLQLWYSKPRKLVLNKMWDSVKHIQMTSLTGEYVSISVNWIPW